MKNQKWRQQVAALPYRLDDTGRVEVLLVTSRDSGRWVLPKGWPIKREPLHHAAAIEAYEEAGAIGRPSQEAIGTYDYQKQAAGDSIACRVAVFPLHVDRLEATWPEQLERKRTWFNSRKAASKVNEPDLQALLKRLNDNFPGRGGGAGSD